MEKLRIIPLAVAFGAVWALSVLTAGWTAAFGLGTAFVEMAASFYIGYGPSFLGALIGALWAFFDAAIAGALIAVIYNVVAKTSKAA